MHYFRKLESLVDYLNSEQIAALIAAYHVAKEAHEGQFRSSGEPYIIHPVAVACILAEMRLDKETLMAALLHDVIEDTPTTKEQLQDQFGQNVAELVDGVSKLDKLKFRDRKEAQAENFRKMIMAMVQDIRVILIKLADRTHNMRTLGSLRPDKRRRIANETLEIYAPIAHRLGINNIKIELEELGFQALYPKRSAVLKKVIQAARGNRKEMILRIHDEIENRLALANVNGYVIGREKNLYSIYNKMKNKEQRFHSILDIYAFKIIVKDLDTCYRVLGLVHSLYKPRPARFKDYIAVPKTNGYQSLHTSMVGPHGLPVEVQIRTEDMDQMADKGVAAHWAYKNQNQKIQTDTTAQLKAQRWMHSLLDLQQSAGNSMEFIENVKSDLFPNELYVFTPKGKIIELPVGATPVDFAYAVHTDVGRACVGAKVNRQPYPLSQPLKSGQTVEVVTAPGARPNAAWLNYVVTSRARAKIRQVLKSVQHSDSVFLGKRLLKHALGSQNKLSDIPQENITNLLKILRIDSFDDLLAAIGTGQKMSVVIAKKLIDNDLNISHEQSKLSIKGTEGVQVTFANCCHPIPNDPIVAHISPGRGLVIHYEGCANIRGYAKELDKYMPVEWGDTQEQEFIAELRIEILNTQGALADITNLIAKNKSNIQKIATEERDGKLYILNILLTTQNRVSLAKIIRKIKRLNSVIKINRIHN